KSGAPRSLAQVMDSFRQRMASAMAEEGNALPPSVSPAYPAAAGAPVQPAPPAGGPLAREFHEMAASQTQRGSVSMGETLRQAFASSGGQPAMMPANVKAAYSKLKAYGL
ncbi:MAG: hypothetical protein PHE36_13830, partial [Novosphingobium sp.]|nr:hypothetical protein [Novosphingobium sp.]